jgi:hypothetical protein
VDRLGGVTQANLSLSFQEATLDAVLRALFSLPQSDQLTRITAMVHQCKKTFATISAQSGPCSRAEPCLLSGVKRTQM